MEPGLVRAVERIEKENNLKLRKIVLVDKNFYNHKKRVSDSTGTFEEIIIDFDDKSDIQKKLRDIHKDVLIATCRMEFSIGYFQKIVPFFAISKLVDRKIKNASEVQRLLSRINSKIY